MPADIVERPSPNHGPRRGAGPIDMLVLHYTGMPTAAEALARMCDPGSEVSAHYVIDETGEVLRLVPESERAWHAGVAFWRGERDVNSRSIGIELVNPGHEFGYRPFPEAQMAALLELAGDIVARHPVPDHNVVGHSDVAPARKTDPGELFDWPRLAAAGIGLWPAAADVPPVDDASAALAEIGYDVGDETAAIAAFQRHFRPTLVDGAADTETRCQLAAVLACL